MRNAPWTPDDIELLTRVYPDTLARDIAVRLNRSVACVYNKAQQLGLKKSAEFLAGPASGRMNKARAEADRARRGYAPWSQEELDTLRRLYPDETAPAIKRILTERSLPSIYNMAKILKLEKSAAFLANKKSGRLDGTQGEYWRFKKGSVPPNKGKKGYDAGGRSHETRFQAGQTPHNTLPIGSYRLDKSGNLQRKINNNPGSNSVRWRCVHELIWIEANGPVPPKHLIVFKPGMRTNILEEITLDKVECVSRVEHIRRHTIHNYPEEIVGAVYARAALNRKIKNVEKHQ